MTGEGKTPAFVVAAPRSGGGKTTLALALMEAMRRRGLGVSPFKAGPDYIDPGHHEAVLGRPSYNLDTWMMGPEGVERTFRARAAGADAAVVEGVMGLFDGKGGARGGMGEKVPEGSTAHLARVLGLPVLLVVDAGGAAGSLAPLVKGFCDFTPGVEVRWVVLNRVASPGHYEMARAFIEEHTGVRVLGYLPKDEGLFMPSRHLGLVTSADVHSGAWKGFLHRAASVVADHVDLDTLLRTAPAVRPGPDPCSPERTEAPPVRIAVMRDRAFCFYYRENLDILEALGAELVEVSPLSDEALPEGTGGVYIGGGYPELHAEALEENLPMREAVRGASFGGMPVFAECGGLMYLGRSIRRGPRRRAMAGVFPFTTRLRKRRTGLGYREAEGLGGCPFLSPGSRVRGHEYHYSKLSASARRVEKVFSVEGRTGTRPEGFLSGMTLATYVHLHFASNPEFARRFVGACRSFAT